MALFDFIKQQNVQEPFTETTFECKRGNLTIRGTEYRPEGENLPEIINCGPMKLGKCYPADVLDMDSYEKIKGVTCPVLIVHGTADKIVHPDYARRAEETYKATTAVQLHIIQGGANSFSKKHDAIAMGYLRDFAKA